MKRVLDVGQCNPDHASISALLTSRFEVEIDRTHQHADAMEAVKSQTYDLVLINRLLDRDHSEGAQILQDIKSDPALAKIPVMIVSNFADAQAAAVALGAEPGFGKSALNAPETIAALEKFLA